MYYVWSMTMLCIHSLSHIFIWKNFQLSENTHLNWNVFESFHSLSQVSILVFSHWINPCICEISEINCCTFQPANHTFHKSYFWRRRTSIRVLREGSSLDHKREETERFLKERESKRMEMKGSQKTKRTRLTFSHSLFYSFDRSWSPCRYLTVSIYDPGFPCYRYQQLCY